MSWGEKSCIHYGYCSIEATINTCNKTCEKYESKSVELSIEMIASEKDPKCPYCKESIYDVIKQYFPKRGRRMMTFSGLNADTVNKKYQ